MCDCCPCQRTHRQRELTDADLSTQQRQQIVNGARDGYETGLKWPAAHHWFQYEPGGPHVYEYRGQHANNPRRDRELMLIHHASRRTHEEWKKAFRAGREEVKAGRSPLWSYEEWVADKFPERAAA